MAPPCRHTPRHRSLCQRTPFAHPRPHDRSAVRHLVAVAIAVLGFLSVCPLAACRSLENAPPAAAPPPPPATSGYDMTCLYKDVSKTDCSSKSVGPWGILTFIVLVVVAGLIIATPFFILYRQSQRGAQKLRICCCGRKYPEYAEAEARAAAQSQDMPRPPEVSGFRNMSTSKQDKQDSRGSSSP